MHPPLSLFWDACRPSLFCISTELQKADSSATYAGLFLSAKNDSDQYPSTYFVGSGKIPIVSFEQNVKIHVRFIFSWSVKLLPYLWIFGCFFHVSTWLLLSARTVFREKDRDIIILIWDAMQKLSNKLVSVRRHRSPSPYIPIHNGFLVIPVSSLFVICCFLMRNIRPCWGLNMTFD